MDNDCVFCKILNGDSPDVVEHITDNWSTLEPKEKVSKGHILVIPSFHCEDILDLNNSNDFFSIAKEHIFSSIIHFSSS